MNRMPFGPLFVANEFDASVSLPLGPAILPQAAEDGTALFDHAATAVRVLLDEGISHVHRAEVLIHSCSERTRDLLVEQLILLTAEMDAVIRRLQVVALERRDALTLTEVPALSIHWAWSEARRRWLKMTFLEHQAWLARPDLDPAAFAPHEGSHERELLPDQTGP